MGCRFESYRDDVGELHIGKLVAISTGTVQQRTKNMKANEVASTASLSSRPPPAIARCTSGLDHIEEEGQLQADSDTTGQDSRAARAHAIIDPVIGIVYHPLIPLSVDATFFNALKPRTRSRMVSLKVAVLPDERINDSDFTKKYCYEVFARYLLEDLEGFEDISIEDWLDDHDHDDLDSDYSEISSISGGECQEDVSIGRQDGERASAEH
ncbi:hypothetical protein CVT26_013517 [Gymnopilus dilepis]|uniref:Uncharacterized protein n=1 Tax=Gymnopilus dilepis TaxID=231916 RepID=A0A409Y5L2_9AGAR|nr:hypothetical protein CVT26_013517 [Gymnopilus dilepis]